MVGRMQFTKLFWRVNFENYAILATTFTWHSFNFYSYLLPLSERLNKKICPYLVVFWIIYWSDNFASRIICAFFFVMVFSLVLPLDLTPAISGQHHGAPPPAANIGDRKIALKFETQPNPIKIGQDVEIKISFADETVKKNVNHVTFHTDISKDGKRLLSEFFTVMRET